MREPFAGVRWRVCDALLSIESCAVNGRLFRFAKVSSDACADACPTLAKLCGMSWLTWMRASFCRVSDIEDVTTALRLRSCS